MQIQSSAYLRSKKPALKKLIDELSSRYEYASVLAQDARAYAYNVNPSGRSAAPLALQSKRGFVVRVYDGTGYAEYSFNDISEEKVRDIVKTVSEKLVPIPEMLTDRFGRLDRPAAADDQCVFLKSSECKIHPDDLGGDKILDRLAEIREKAISYDDRIFDAASRYEFAEIHKMFISPKKDMEQNIMWSDGMVSALVHAGEEVRMSYKPYSCLGGAELLDDIAAGAEDAAKTAVELMGLQPVTPGVYDCICSPDITGLIAHEAFGHGVEMDMFVKDRALAKDYIGRRVASDLVTMHDTACAMDDTGSYFFDDEGNLASDTLIIDHGILKKGMADELSALSLGVPPTGNGRRESYERKAYTRMTNTYFEPGTDSLEDMIGSIKYGFLLDQAESGMEDPKNWGIQCMVSFGREIKDGKLTGRLVGPVVLTGYVPDLLKSISMVSPDLDHTGTGGCGKGWKEFVKVSCGGPYIKAKIRLG